MTRKKKEKSDLSEFHPCIVKLVKILAHIAAEREYNKQIKRQERLSKKGVKRE